MDQKITMLQQIQAFDTQLFLILNGLHHPAVDAIMQTATQKLTWVPLYAWLLFRLYQKFGSTKLKYFFFQIIGVVVAVALADQLASAFLKPWIGRLRPCHELALQTQIHLVGSCGGQYGFVSSHASTTFAVATCFVLFFRNKPAFKRLFLWATLVAYSRVYVGVHYPLDVAAGALLGVACGWVIWFGYVRLTPTNR